jgi:hypothetical protein
LATVIGRLKQLTQINANAKKELYLPLLKSNAQVSTQKPLERLLGCLQEKEIYINM